MKMRSLGLGWLLLIAALAGCTPTFNYEKLNATPPELVRKDGASVDVIASGGVTRPHIDAGILQVTSMDGTDAMMQQLRDRAGQMGCDALVIRRVHDDASASATCVVYTAGPQPIAPPAAP